MEEWQESLKNPISLDFITEVLAPVIRGDEAITKIVFLAMLSAYTEQDQLSIIQSSDSSTGKSWIDLRVADLFPKEDVIEIAYSSPAAFFFDIGEWSEEEKAIIVNLERKILIWLDMPHSLVLERLRPLISKDRKTILYKTTDRNERYGLRSKNILLTGFFSTFFLSANAKFDIQDLTRSIILSPSDDPEKIKEVLKLQAEMEKDPAAFMAKLDSDPKRKWLKERIKRIRDLRIRYIKVPFTERLCEEFLKRHPNLKPRAMRDFPKLISLTRAVALLNAESRGLDENHDIEAIWQDGLEALRLYDQIAPSNELGLSPECYEFFEKIFIPAIKDSASNSQVLEPEVTRKDLSRFYYKVKQRQISEKRLRRFLEDLVAAGLVLEDDSRKPHTYSLTEHVAASVGYNNESISNESFINVKISPPHPPGDMLLENKASILKNTLSEESKLKAMPLLRISFEDRAIRMLIEDPLEKVFEELEWKVGEMKTRSEILNYFKNHYDESKSMEKALLWGEKALEAGLIEFNGSIEDEAFYLRLK